MDTKKLALGAARAVLFSALIVLAGCNSQTSSQGNHPAPTRVGIYEVHAEPLTLSSALPGRTRAWRTAEVRPQVSGIVTERLFEEGGVVQEGQILYRIDDAPYRAALARTEATLINARNLTQRYKKLVGAKSISQQQYDDALAALRTAEAEYEAARINLNYTQIDAPISGKIGRSLISEGALVTNGQQQELATITQLDPIYVDIVQPVTKLLDLQQAINTGLIQTDENNDVNVSLILENGQSYPHGGTLKFSEVIVDESTGSVTLRAEFPNPNATLLPGMFVRAVVQEGTLPKAILVPQQAIVRDNRGIPSVWVVSDDDTVSRREVSVRRTVGNTWLLESGLSEGEKVVVEGLQRLHPGAVVEPSPAINVHVQKALGTAG